MPMKNQHSSNHSDSLSSDRESEFCIIYCTASSKDEASNLAKILLKDNLCACVNIGSEITSLYKWNDQIEESNEVPLIIKTNSKFFSEISELIKQNHSYDTPCILKLKIEDGEKDFLNWLENSIKTV